MQMLPGGLPFYLYPQLQQPYLCAVTAYASWFGILKTVQPSSEHPLFPQVFEGGCIGSDFMVSFIILDLLKPPSPTIANNTLL